MPKDLGGLRLFSMKRRNEAILAKLCWRLTHEKGKPWANMLLAKYLCPNRLTEEGGKLPCSRIWAACKKGGPIYVKGLRWIIKNGESVNMWLDFWLPFGRLRESIIGPLNRGEDELSVRQCFDENHFWKPSSISFELPDNMLNTIKATPFSFSPQTNDSLTWAYSKNGSFSLQAAYLIAKGLKSLSLETQSFNWVWKSETLPKIQFPLWLCFHDSLPTAQVLSSRGLTIDPVCKLCNKHFETIEHLFRGCEIAHQFWLQLQTPHCYRNSFTLPFKAWLEVNCIDKLNVTVRGIPWRVLFPMGLWFLWTHRNIFLFRSGSVDTQNWRKCIQGDVEFYYIGLSLKTKQLKNVVSVGWEKPPRGWVKLNTDGSAMKNPDRAGGGGLFRDHDGVWLKGFARGLGFTNSILAELWAPRDGLLLAKELGFQQLIIELDALSVVILMNNESENLLMEPLLTDCRNLLKEISSKRVIHAFREAN